MPNTTPPDIAQLYQMAQDAGMIEPSMAGSQEMPWDNTAAFGSGVPAPQLGPQAPDAQLPDDGYMNPQTFSTSGGAVTTPGGVNPPMPSAVGAGGTRSQGAGYSVSQGKTGINMNTLGALDKRDPKLRGMLDSTAASVAQDYAPVMDQNQRAQIEAKDAATAKMEADLQHVQEERDAANLMKGLHDELTKSEQNILLSETARKNQLISQYTASLADFSASKVDPNQLWHGMSGGMRFGTLVSAFVHDFLGAKGIKTSAMDTFNTAIDRNINAQIHNINNKLEVAKGFKTLYEMESQKSASAAETRARIKGYMLESAKQHIIANMSQYQSLLATAQGKEALAQIDAAYAKNYQDVINHIETTSTARQGQMIQWEEAKMHNAMEGYKASIAARANSLEAQKFNYQIAKDKLAGKLDEQASGVVDPESGLVKWRLKRPDDKEGNRKVFDTMASAESANNALSDLRELARKVGGGNILNTIADGTRFNDEDRRQYEAIADRLAHSLVKANGERATEQDIAQFRKSLPSINTALTNGGVEQILAHTQKDSLDNVQAVIKQYTYDLPKEEWYQGPQNRSFEKAYGDSKATENMLKKGGMKKDMIDTAMEEMSSPAGHKSANDTVLKATGLDKKEANLAWEAAAKADPYIGARGKDGVDSSGKSFTVYTDKHGDPTFTAKNADPGDAPTWAVAIMGLSKTAAQGGTGAQMAKDKITRWAMEDITNLQASGDKALDGFDAKDLARIQHLARYELHKLTGQSDFTTNVPGRASAQPGRMPGPIGTIYQNENPE